VLVYALLALLLAALVAASPAAAEETDVLGNNLSVPVIFSEGYNIVGVDVDTDDGFRGDAFGDNLAAITPKSYLEYGFTSGGLDLAGVTLLSDWFYEQKTLAEWQAQWADARDDVVVAPVEVSRLDWGDSLLAKAWPTRAKIRLEIRLYSANDRGLQGYAMNHVYGAGIDEVWAAADAADPGQPATGTGQLVTPAETTVYSNCGRLTVDKLNIDGTTTQILSYPVSQKYGVDGPGLFGAEINVGGYVLYGYTLDGRALKLSAGQYRVTFSLDESATWNGITVARNAHIAGLDPLDAGASEFPFQSYLSEDGFSSWVDFTLVASTGGGKKPR
jgi:hypothetical protein